MPRTLLYLTGHDHVGHLKWADASGSQYMSVTQAIDSRLYAVSNNMSFAGTLGHDTTEHQYYMNRTGCSNCAGNCRCSHCSTQDDMETDLGLKDVSDFAKNAAKKAGQFAHKAGEAASKAYEAGKVVGKAAAVAAKKAYAEHTDPSGLKEAQADVQKAENGEKTAATELRKIDQTKLPTEVKEKITDAEEKLSAAQQAMQELKEGLASVASAVASAV
jgi:hypothetical protein